jgi:predicted nucleic acid-binding protein
VRHELETGSLLHVDACCWIDLFACGRIEEIVEAVACRWIVPEYVMRHEVLTVLSEAGAEERCDFAPLVAKGLVAVYPIRSAAEKEELVRFAASLDDGEASVCALASVHGGTVASNDRKVSSVLRRLTLPIPVVGTPELIFRWAERTEASRGAAKQVIERITARARFSPRRDATCADWWYETLQG